MTNPLATTSVLLHMTISKWAAEVTDLKALKAVARAFSSDTNDDKYKKALFIGDPLKGIDRCAGRLRNHFYKWTFNWNEAGQGRLMPSMDFREFAGEHKALSSEFFAEVETFLDDYPDHCVTAKELKGDMFLASDYPDVELVRKKFDIQLITLPFPTTTDFRVEAPEAIITDLKDQINQSIEAVNGTVDMEVNMRLRVRIEMLLKTLRVGKRFNKSLLSELDFLCSMAENIKATLTPDTLLRIQVIRKNILVCDSEQIRNSQSLQDSLINICGKLL
jgi:hypothetical protein